VTFFVIDQVVQPAPLISTFFRHYQQKFVIKNVLILVIDRLPNDVVGCEDKFDFGMKHDEQGRGFGVADLFFEELSEHCEL